MKSGKLVNLLFFIFFVFGLIISQKTLDQRYTPESSLNEVLHLPDGKILKVASMGFSSLVSDFLWLKSVLYFGKYMFDEDNPYVDVLAAKAEKTIEPHAHTNESDHDHEEDLMNQLQDVNDQAKPKSQFIENEFNLAHEEDLKMLHDFECKGMAPFIFPLLKRVVELNPYFMGAYRFGGLIVLHETGEIDQACDLLEYGWKYNPDNWEIAYYLGFIELLYKGDTQKSLEWLSHSLLIPGHPPFIQNVYNSLLQKGNYKNVVINYLKGIYESSEDEKLQEQILKMLNKMAQSSSNN